MSPVSVGSSSGCSSVGIGAAVLIDLDPCIVPPAVLSGAGVVRIPEPLLETMIKGARYRAFGSEMMLKSSSS